MATTNLKSSGYEFVPSSKKIQKYATGTIVLIPIMFTDLTKYVLRPAVVISKLNSNTPDQLFVPLGTDNSGADDPEYIIRMRDEDKILVQSSTYANKPGGMAICRFKNITCLDITILQTYVQGDPLLGFVVQDRIAEIITKVKILIGV